MKRAFIIGGTFAVAAVAMVAFVAADAPKDAARPDLYSGKFFEADESVTTGSVNGISYQATAGTLVVHPKDWDDAAQNGGAKNPDAKGIDESPSPEASMFFVYYSKRGESPENRPVTFLYNGGPGSSTVWLHMGSFRTETRVVTKDDSHTEAAPYQLVDNDSRCSMRAISSSSTHPAPASAASRARTRRKRSTASIPMRAPSRTSSKSSSPSTIAGTRRNISSAKDTARRARRWSRTISRTTTASI